MHVYGADERRQQQASEGNATPDTMIC
uniref:Uncharacterized protein n=1 Tax=Anguilla anguilla TaxID=7936 RepID=A0A0E9W9I3_ANGAN